MSFNFSWGLLAFCSSVTLNLIVIFVAKRFHIFIDAGTNDKPQRFHNSSIPRAGGIGIFLPVFIFLLTSETSPLFQGLLYGGVIIFLSGLIEDFNASLTPRFRLLLQCSGGTLFILLSETYLSDLGFGITLPAYIGIPFSIFAIVGIINAINIIDGFNGLASGIALMALISIAFLLVDSPSLDVVSILIGSILGFWVINFPWGKIFLGDGGAYLLGFILASILIHLTQEPLGGGARETSPWFGLALLIYPFWEVIFSIYRRAGKKSPLLPDDQHIHQYLYRSINSRIKGGNPLTSLLILTLISPFMFLAFVFSQNPLALLTLSLLFILSYLILYIRIKPKSPLGLD